MAGRDATAEALVARATQILERLVAFDTTSSLSNLALIAWVEDYLGGHGVASRRIASDDGKKANLLATVGPAAEGGVVLSGHTDVVPVTDQPWTSDPFTLVQRGERLFGRGTCDMKGFLALSLAAVPDLLAAGIKRPAHLAFSYDEEIGCFGAPRMIEVIARELPAPALAVVGEPTMMQAVQGHKSIDAWRITITGHEAHSAQTHLGVSANMEAIPLLAALADLARRLEAAPPAGSPFHPPHATLTIGRITGGTAGNILARQCRILMDLRCPPGMDPQALMADIHALAGRTDAALKARFPECGVAIEHLSHVPSFRPETGGVAEAFARRLTGDNGPARVVSYASEAGQFQNGGFSTILCGPGSIDQAHQPDEYVDVVQMQRGAAFMARLVEALAE
jgi:acetylornithine deacetylase